MCSKSELLKLDEEEAHERYLENVNPNCDNCNGTGFINSDPCSECEEWALGWGELV